MFAWLHRQLTKAAIYLGPHNPIGQFFLRRASQKAGCSLVDLGTVLELRKGNSTMRLSPKHFVYVPNLARKFDTYFEPVISEDSEGKSVVDYSRPRLHTYRGSGLQFELAAFPEEDAIIDAYFRWYKPQPGDCIFDVGAHCGVSTYFFSKGVGPQGRVIAFEPDPVNRSLLLRNIERHHMTNVTVVDAALAANRGHEQFYGEGTIGSCFSRLSSRATVGNLQTVATLTLADAYAKWGDPNLCKMDIEGAEVEVLAAAAELLTSANTQFALDTSHVVNGRLTAGPIEKLLRACGFEVESAPIAGMMTTWARPLQETAPDLTETSELVREAVDYQLV